MCSTLHCYSIKSRVTIIAEIFGQARKDFRDWMWPFVRTWKRPADLGGRDIKFGHLLPSIGTCINLNNWVWVSRWLIRSMKYSVGHLRSEKFSFRLWTNCFSFFFFPAWDPAVETPGSVSDFGQLERCLIPRTFAHLWRSGMGSNALDRSPTRLLTLFEVDQTTSHCHLIMNGDIHIVVWSRTLRWNRNTSIPPCMALRISILLQLLLCWSGMVTRRNSGFTWVLAPYLPISFQYDWDRDSANMWVLSPFF